MGQLKVLHHTTWKTECGIALYAEQLIQALERMGIHSSVNPVDISAIRAMSEAEMRARLADLCREAQQYDVLHIHHEFSFFANGPCVLRRSNKNFMFLLRKLIAERVPTAVTFHGELQGSNAWDFGRRRRVGRFLGERLRRRTSLHAHQWRLPSKLRAPYPRFRGISTSPRALSTYINGGLHPSGMSVIPLAAPRPCRELSTVDSQAAKERLGLPRHCTLLSQFGFVSGYKGYEWTVRALEVLPENYYLAVVGGRHPDLPGEPTLNRILEIWHGRNPERMRVTGFVNDEERDLYHAATDICLAPYVANELSGSGAITWALTSGKPVIASTIPAFREINDEYDCMLTVPPWMVHELAWQIRRLAGSVKLQQQLTKNASRYAQEHSWDKIAGRYATQFAELVAPQKRAASPALHELPHSQAA